MAQSYTFTNSFTPSPHLSVQQPVPRRRGRPPSSATRTKLTK